MSYNRQAGQVEVFKGYYDRELDNETEHTLEVRLLLGDAAPIVLEREFTFRRMQPNGPRCDPVCWYAQIK